MSNKDKAKPTNKKLFLVLVVVALATIAGMLTASFLKSSKSQIYLYNTSYEKGDKITKDKLVKYSVDTKMLKLIAESGEEYITDENIDNFVESYFACDVPGKTPALTSHSTKTGGNKLVNAIEDGMVATTIEVNNVSGVSPSVTPGCYFNIYSAINTKNGQNIFKLMIQKAEVLSVQGDKDDDGSLSELKALTFQTTPEQAAQLQYANIYGTLVFSLVNSDTYKDTNELFIETEKGTVTVPNDNGTPKEVNQFIVTSNMSDLLKSYENIGKETGTIAIHDTTTRVDADVSYLDKNNTEVLGSDLIEGQEYHDNDGNKFIYKNGRLEHVKDDEETTDNKSEDE